MKPIVVFLTGLFLCAHARAQLFMFTREQMIRYTETNPFGRFDDGRPKVPDAVLEKCKGLSAEEIWGILPGKGFPQQYEGNWQILHPGRKLIGRAVTAQFMPLRPDVGTVIDADAKARGMTRSPGQRVIDLLQPGDVLVADVFGRVEDGAIIGDNLAYYIMEKTGTGAVIDGAIRDLEGVFPFDMSLYYRAVHPSYGRGIMLTGINIPVRIGSATVMPGDVVFGDREGVFFIPPQFIGEIVKRAEVTHIHDDWTKMKFKTGKYKSSDIYGSPTDPALKKEYEEYLKRRLDEQK